MITIIKGGKNEFLGHCKWCGCDFRYTRDDVMDAPHLEGREAIKNVLCPSCDGTLVHHGEHGTSMYPPMGQTMSAYYPSGGCLTDLGLLAQQQAQAAAMQARSAKKE